MVRICSKRAICCKNIFIYNNICSKDGIYRCVPTVHLFCKPIQLLCVRNLIFFDFFVIVCWLIMGIIIFAETIFVIVVFEGSNDITLSTAFLLSSFICECFLADIALPVFYVTVLRAGRSFCFYLCQLVTCREDGFWLFHWCCSSGFVSSDKKYFPQCLQVQCSMFPSSVQVSVFAAVFVKVCGV